MHEIPIATKATSRKYYDMTSLSSKSTQDVWQAMQKALKMAIYDIQKGGP